MKKFFALMLVVAMLSVAGSAMAITISGDTTASVTAAETAIVTVTTTTAHSGDVEFELTGTAKDWTVVTRTTATFMPPADTAAGSYTASIVAVESWVSGDVSGHGSPQTEKSAPLTISVTVASSSKPEEKKETATAPVVVTIKAEKAPKISFSGLIKPLPQVVKKAVEDNAASALGNNAVAKDENNLQPATSDNYDGSGTPDAGKKNIEKAGAKLALSGGDSDDLALAASAPFTVKETGNQQLSLGDGLTADKLGSDYQGKPLKGKAYNRKNIRGGVSVQFAAASAASGDMVFFDAKGVQITTIPASGDITAVAYVEAGETYEPVFYTTLTSSEKAALSGDFAQASNVSVVVSVTSGEPAPVDPWGGKTYRIDIPQASIDRIASIDGRTLRTLVAATVSAEPVSDTTLYNVGGVSKDVVASLPTLANIAPNAANEAYIMAFKYSRPTITGRTISGDPEFYPQGPTGDQKGRVYNDTGLATLADIETGNIGYIVFAVASNDTFASFYAANADFASPRVLATSVPVVPTPTPTYPEGTSSSSGGCSAGSAALALAVLGSFILTRKK